MRTVGKIEFEDGAVVQPTDMGVLAIERLIREGLTLAEATARIAGGPKMFQPGHQTSLAWR